MSADWARLVADWTEAGVIDAESAARIRAFELSRASATRWRWPMWLALAFGGLALGAGVLLFVAAHWDTLSPTERFAIVLGLVAAFHVGGAVAASRRPALATTLHAVGTIALGSGIFLAGQIFNLAEHWPGGVMLWALGAAVGALLLRDAPQVACVAVLGPAWLASEWVVAVEPPTPWTVRVMTAGLLLTALAYFVGSGRDRGRPAQRALRAIGALALLPSALALAMTSDPSLPARALPLGLTAIGWFVALGGPLTVSIALGRTEAWPMMLAILWVTILIGLQTLTYSLPLYAWWAIGAMGLVAWGLGHHRVDRINMGAAIFAGTIIAFYFSEVMTKLDRSASLVGLGLVLLAGGWAFERARRHIVQRAKGEAS
jgi:uncharacterized membrane protein